MSITSGKMTVTLMRIAEPLSDKSGWRDSMRERLIELAFTEPPQGIGREEIQGWCRTDNPLKTDFTDFNAWLFGDWAIFSLRTDKKRIPASLLKAKLQLATQAWAEERGLGRCPVSMRAEIKENLTDELLARQLPNVHTTEVALNVSSGMALIASHSPSAQETIRKRIFRTFNVRMLPWSPIEWLTRPVAEAILMEKARDPRVEIGRWRGSDFGEDGAPTPSTFAGEFLIWLWYTSEVQSGQIHLEEPTGAVDVWIDERLSFRNPDEVKATAVLTGDNPSAELTARAALSSGKIPAEVRIGVRRDDREFLGTLKSSTLDLHNLALPQVVVDGSEEVILERMYLFEEFISILGALIREFGKCRTHPDWKQTESEIESWWSNV